MFWRLFYNAGRSRTGEGVAWGKEEGEAVQVWMRRLCEGKPRLVVDFEDLLDGVDVRRRPQVQTQVVFIGCAHDLLWKWGSKLEKWQLSPDKTVMTHYTAGW